MLRFDTGRLRLLSLALAAVLAACGGGDDGDDSAPGSLVEAPEAVGSYAPAELDLIAAANGVAPLVGPARCGVQVTALDYRTRGPRGEGTNASAALLTPTGDSACLVEPPLVAYARGTEVLKTRTLADARDSETLLLAMMFAAQGYAVVATDYLGFAKSRFAYHPYLHAESEATSVLDSVRAARRAAAELGQPLSSKLLLAGYSQGGQASMAAHRAAERDNPGEFAVAAGAHLAGPYNLSGMMRAGVAFAGDQFFVPFLVTAMQKVYGNVYTSADQAFKAPYAATIENLLPNPTLTFTTLVTTGALPGAAGETPAQIRAALMQPAFLTSVQTDDSNGLYVDAKAQDLLDWSPRAPLLMCSGAADPTVPKALNQDAAKAAFDARGLANVTSIDVDPQIQAAFGPGGVAPTDPSTPEFATYYGNYHGGYAPPFCLAAARQLFDAVR